jgi:hypothetical protein
MSYPVYGVLFSKPEWTKVEKEMSSRKPVPS